MDFLIKEDSKLRQRDVYYYTRTKLDRLQNEICQQEPKWMIKQLGKQVSHIIQIIVGIFVMS